ncbi:hydroxylase [Bordetella pertussis]|nr:hydroxylase [Bordetella pertussis]
MAIQRLNQDTPGHASIVQLTGVYHNLLRRWKALKASIGAAQGAVFS